MALAFTPANHSDEEMVDELSSQVTSLIARGVFNPWCDICKAKVSAWHYEVGQTPFATLEEATPHLRAIEAENLRARAFLRTQGN
jgi:hypothetical protein